jgi:TPP-dependent indolepyruvate ferredoxin oxidoreductase alpha subunit
VPSSGILLSPNGELTPGAIAHVIADQVCAAEKCRRRKQKKLIDPPKRALNNEAVCEGCGDYGVQSNCVSILPPARLQRRCQTS